MKGKLQHIAVVSGNRDKYSETFIHDSFDFFPCAKTFLYGAYLPTHFTHDWRLAGEPIPISKPPFWANSALKTQPQAAQNLRAWLQKKRPDLVLAHYGPAGVAVSSICKELGIPLVVHFHGYDAYRDDILQSYGQQYPQLFADAQQIIAVSADMRRQLLGLGAAPEKLATEIYGVDCARFQPSPMHSAPFTFLFVGRFVPKKAPDALLRAFSTVLEVVPEVRLRMVGDGELLGECQRLVRELGLGESVSFLGILSPDQVAAALAGAHALVLPSRRTPDGDSEGTPLVVLEAGAAMRPVIATRHGGISEVITHGVNGFLLEENDEDLLAGAMICLAQNPTLAASMGKQALETIQSLFSQARYHQNLWQLLEKAMDLPQNS